MLPTSQRNITRQPIQVIESKTNMYDEIEYTEDCIECEGEQALSVLAVMDIDSGEIVKFINQECVICGWNQQS